MFVSWCFELENTENVRWVVNSCVREERCGGLESFMRMTRDGKGFVCLDCHWLHVSEFHPPLHPYFIWSANCNKESRRAFAQIGMHGIKEYLKTWERRDVKLELEKWGTSRSAMASSSRWKRGRPRSSKKKKVRRTL
ncbi:hypothetical protein SUGI_0258900 [Cryptomeria japonica]|nr:hypothetical protein SUGI_0258900 [Cryptomeria japonica]